MYSHHVFPFHDKSLPLTIGKASSICSCKKTSVYALKADKELCMSDDATMISRPVHAYSNSRDIKPDDEEIVTSHKTDVMIKI